MTAGGNARAPAGVRVRLARVNAVDPADHRRVLTVPPRWNGPPGSANGGYFAGLLAAHLTTDPDRPGTAVEVTLRHPPPLGTAIVVIHRPEGVRASFGGAVVAEARTVELDVDLLDPVSFGAARETGAAYPGMLAHPFPGCVVCGPQRPAPDGLGLRPGPVGGRPGTTAAAWVPGPSTAGEGATTVGAEVAWAALDCPGGWALDLAGRPAVLGRMTAQLDALPHVGDRCVVMGAVLGRDGRKAHTATTLYDGDGRVLGGPGRCGSRSSRCRGFPLCKQGTRRRLLRTRGRRWSGALCTSRTREVAAS